MLNLYLLHVRQPETIDEEAFMEALLDRTDEERAHKAGSIQSVKARVLSLAAGVLLQKGMKDLTEDREQPFLRLSTEELLSEIVKPKQLKYRYGENGKPYLADNSAFFSLSHSGEYILLGISEKPIGVDIQKMQAVRFDELAGRFFADDEAGIIREAGDSAKKAELFYRFWTEKEAYTKCYGLAMAETAARPVCSTKEEIYVPVAAPEGYRAAVCISNVIEEK